VTVRPNQLKNEIEKHIPIPGSNTCGSINCLKLSYISNIPPTLLTPNEKCIIGIEITQKINPNNPSSPTAFKGSTRYVSNIFSSITN
jgi:hypothetical protein